MNKADKGQVKRTAAKTSLNCQLENELSSHMYLAAYAPQYSQNLADET